MNNQAGPIRTISLPITRFKDNAVFITEDLLSPEEPLAICVNDRPFYVTMRTKGDDMELAVGLCFTEGIIQSINDILRIDCAGDGPENRIDITVNEANLRWDGGFKHKTTSACFDYGICGEDFVSNICSSIRKRDQTLSISINKLIEMQQNLNKQQALFGLTGATHAAAILDSEGNLLAFFEDVGRHNALDKAIGKVLFERKEKEAKVTILSSRLSYEMVQKASHLDIEILAAASAATSLAVELARQIHLTLIGFWRSRRGNIYTFPERIVF